MPIIVTYAVPSSSVSSSTTTVQSIIDATSQDMRKLLQSNVTNDAAILIDYCNRVSLQMLRSSRWKFLLSAPQRFVTEPGQTDYWIGANAGSIPSSAVSTGLNLTDLGLIKEDSVYDRSNFRSLLRTEEPPNLAKLSYRDGTFRTGKPAVWRNAVDSPNILNIYPASDNQNSYQPSPEAPICSTAVSGALAQRTYFVRVSFVDSLNNESACSAETQVTVPANSVLVVKPPQPFIATAAANVNYSRWNVYVSTSSNTETLQSSNISTGVNFTEPNTGLVAGVSFPTTNNLEPLRGYIVEFRYYRARTQLVSAAQIIQIPDDYKDIVIAGVNMLGFEFLRRPQEMGYWQTIYRTGMMEMIRDKNLFPRGGEFMRPDSAAVGNTGPSIESFDNLLLGGTN